MTRCKHFSLDGIFQEMESCSRNFYSLPHILLRVCANLWQRRTPLISLIGNLSYRRNFRLDCKAYAGFKRQWRGFFDAEPNANATTPPMPERI